MFNLVSNIESCTEIPQLIYYSHIPVVIVSLVMGFFVFLRNRKSLVNILIFFLAADFAIWSLFDLIIWVNKDSSVVMFFWMSIIPIDLLIYVLSSYLLYVFLYQKDVRFWVKVVFFILILPTLILMSTKYNLLGFDSSSCNGIDGLIGKYYLYGTEFLVLLLMIFVALRKILKEKDIIERVKFIYFSFSLLSFLAIFLIGNTIASVFETSNFWWSIAQYGMFGMVVFMGFLAFIIVKYKALDIKLVGAQALVFSLVLLIGSQFFFIQNNTNRVVTGITLALAIGFGIFLVKSVKLEVERKEQLQLMADKLSQANDQLRKLDNAKTEFISIASHQLRTPITAIKGFASLLLEGSYGEISEGVHGALDKIYVSTERLVNLIEELLNVSRIESGRMQFTFEKASVPKLLQELYDNFILVAKTKKFYLDLKMPEVELPEVVMDYSKVRELVSNFVDNALKYTEKGGVTVKAELKEGGVMVDANGFVIPGMKADFGPVVRITVSDTGIGIPQEEIPYLFKKFSRGKDVSRLHVGGTGLGLYVGKAIAEAHNGQVWVESDGAGMGSRFIIEIPVEHQG